MSPASIRSWRRRLCVRLTSPLRVLAVSPSLHQTPVMSRKLARLSGLGICAAVLMAGMGNIGLQDAVANGDTRTISLYHTHTKESATITFRRDGSYDREALKKLNWFLRDWRRDEPTEMDPRLFDIIWQVQRDVGTNQPMHVVSAYRSPQTNSMLRRRSRGVAKHSQHTLGKAMDFYLPDVEMAKVRSIAMRLQYGGVGFYPSAFNPFVHLDAGSVRSWPRMPREQLARLFPDGRTVHIPADGKPMDGYEVAKADILSKGGSVSGLAYADAGENVPTTSGSRRSLWAALFGGADEDEDVADSRPARGGSRQASSPRASQVAAYAPSSSHEGNAGMFNINPIVPSAPRTVRNVAPVVPVAPPQPAPETPAAPVAIAAAPEPAITAPLPAARPPSLSPLLRPAEAEQTRLAALAATASGLATPQAGDAQLDPRVLSIVPLPPKRPDELATGPVLVSIPTPPSRPVELAALSPQLQTGAPAANDGTANPLQNNGSSLRGSVADPARQAIEPFVPPMLAVAHPAPPPRNGSVQTASVDTGGVSVPTTVSALPRPVQPAPRDKVTRDDLKSLFVAIAGEATPRRAATVLTARTRTANVSSVPVTMPQSAVVSQFGKTTDAPRADRFTGPAVKPLATATFTRN